MAEMKSVLVTGGAGYIGSVLTEKLLNIGYKVTILDNFTYSNIGIKHLLANQNLHVVNGDIRDKRIISSSLIDIDCIIHLAAIANDPSGELNPQLTRQINLEVYPMLISEAKKAGVKRLINTSTFGVYGIKEGINITENESLNPLKEYSVCKAKGEKILQDSSSDSFTTVSLRCSTVCGWSPRMRFDLIVNTLTALAIYNNKITVWGGEQKRPQIHIEDLTRYITELIKIDAKKINGKIFNAGGENTSIREIAERIKETLDKNLVINYELPRDDERSYHVSSDKILHELNLSPNFSIKRAIKGIINSYEKGIWMNPNESRYHNIAQMKELKMDQIAQD